MIYKKELTSSCLAEAEYDDEKHEITLTFLRDGSTELIQFFPKRLFDKLCSVASPGSVYNYEIKGVKFTEETLKEELNKENT